MSSSSTRHSFPQAQCRRTFVVGQLSWSADPGSQVDIRRIEGVSGSLAIRRFGSAPVRWIGSSGARRFGGLAARQLGSPAVRQFGSSPARRFGGLATRQLGGPAVRWFVGSSVRRSGGPAVRRSGGSAVRRFGLSVGSSAARQLGGSATGQRRVLIAGLTSRPISLAADRGSWSPRRDKTHPIATSAARVTSTLGVCDEASMLLWAHGRGRALPFQGDRFPVEHALVRREP